MAHQIGAERGARTTRGLDGKNQHLGYHQDERAAAMAVDSFVRLFMPTMAQQKANFPTLEELHESKLKVTANDLKRRDLDPGPAKGVVDVRRRRRPAREGRSATHQGAKERLFSRFLGGSS